MPLARFYSVSALRRCIFAGASLTKCTAPTDRPTSRRIVFATFESRRAAFLSAFSLPSVFPPFTARRSLFSLFRRNEPRLFLLSPRWKLSRYFLSEKGLRTIRDNLEYDLLLESFASIVSKWSSDLYVRKKPFSERCARDLSRIYTVKYGCAITNYILPNMKIACDIIFV